MLIAHHRSEPGQLLGRRQQQHGAGRHPQRVVDRVERGERPATRSGRRTPRRPPRPGVSPATIRCTRRTSWPPEVGFCFGTARPASPPSPRCRRRGSGVPSDAEQGVLRADRGDERREAGRLAPVQHHQRRRRASSARRSPRSARSRQNSFSTALTTRAVLRARWRRRTSPGSACDGSAPVNSGGPAVLEPLAGLRSHLADLVIVTSLGLNWNGDRTAVRARLRRLRCATATGRRASASPCPSAAGP